MFFILITSCNHSDLKKVSYISLFSVSYSFCGVQVLHGLCAIWYINVLRTISPSFFNKC
jgi:hypothetical protein